MAKYVSEACFGGKCVFISEFYGGGFFEVSKTYAAISLHIDALRYLELSGEPGNLSIVRSAELPLPSGGVSSIMGVMSSLRAQVGRFPPLAFGVPTRETMVRLVEYPRMPMEEAKQAFQFDFDRHFTWSHAESAFDLCEVESPVPPAAGKMTMLVAACRNEIISQILDVAEEMKLQIKSIEPVSTAILRAVMGKNPSRNGLWYSIFGAPGGTAINFALAYNDNGIFYRLGGTPAGTRFDADSEEGVLAISEEIQRTMAFVSNQFKNIPLSSIVLHGSLAGNERIAAVIENMTSVRPESSDIFGDWGVRDANHELNAGFVASLGLCMRDEGERYES